MEQVVGVRFKPAGKIYYFSPNRLTLRNRDGVIVETSRGMEYGYVVQEERSADISEDNGEVKPIIRLATAKDKIQAERNREREKSAFQICLQKIEKLGCPMRLLRAEYTFDRNKIVFFFTADGRVDFRDLVKELATVFHTRIELRQVGIRDKAKQVSGIGPCGRTLCCSTYLAEFCPVSIKMAKNQGLSLNPSKISGVCGRLMCCLRYENDQYKGMNRKAKSKKAEVRVNFRVGMKVITNEGNGQVIYVNTQKRMVKVQLEGQEAKMISWDEVAPEEND